MDVLYTTTHFAIYFRKIFENKYGNIIKSINKHFKFMTKVWN